nr:master DNA invertase Mpi family serine-type recombinase [uncultured Treponema sp.]
MIYGYIRVSTDKQTVKNQRFEITDFCRRNNLKIDAWIEEIISGTIDPERRALGKLLKNVSKGDLIICSELSRLGRSLFMIMSILNLLMKNGVRVWTIKDNYRLGDDIQSKVLAFAFGLSAEIERNLISQRTKEALERKRAEGIKLGRPAGSKSNKSKLDGAELAISVMILAGTSVNKIAKLYGIHRNTVKRFIINRNLNSKENRDRVRSMG